MPASSDSPAASEQAGCLGRRRGTGDGGRQGLRTEALKAAKEESNLSCDERKFSKYLKVDSGWM